MAAQDVGSFPSKLQQLLDNKRHVSDIINYCESTYRSAPAMQPVIDTTQKYLQDACVAVADHVLRLSTELTTMLASQDQQLVSLTQRVQFASLVSGWGMACLGVLDGLVVGFHWSLRVVWWMDVIRLVRWH